MKVDRGAAARILVVGMTLSFVFAPCAVAEAEPETESGRAEGQEDYEPLPISFPKETWKHVGPHGALKYVDNIEDSLRKPELPMVPKGLTNLALGKPVTGSDRNPLTGSIFMSRLKHGDYRVVTDGCKDGWYTSEDRFVETEPGTQSIEIDLQGSCEIYAVAIWHYNFIHDKPRVYLDVIVQVSDDLRFREGVCELFNNDVDNSSGLGRGEDAHYVESSWGRIICADGVKGRYVRLYSNGNSSNDANHYMEVEVWGRPAL